MDVVGLDVLGPKWRVLSASVGLAFAFSEAISGAPQVLAHRLAIQSASDLNEREPTPTRRALMLAGEDLNNDENEVD